MASSPTDICNLALGHLGESQIVSLDEDSTASRACNLHYELCRDGLLRSHRWNFAIRRANLTELTETPLFQWTHQYQMPNDCLRILSFNELEEGDWITAPFELEGSLLLTDEVTARVVYVHRVTDVRKYDPLFVEALAMKLAIKLTESIRGTTRKTEELAGIYASTVAPLARRIDANESGRRKGSLEINSKFVRARGAPGLDFNPRRVDPGTVAVEPDDHIIDGGAP